MMQTLTNIKKLYIYILVVLALLIVNARNCRAQSLEADTSATLKSRVWNESYDYRIENLRNYLHKFNSPLIEYSDDFVNFADIYGLDYRLVPAITGVESTFGIHIPYKSFNAYGWANGEYRFISWPDSIDHVSMTLRTKYIDNGAGTISKIAKRYAPPSTTWGGKVKFFIKKIDTLPLSFDI